MGYGGYLDYKILLSSLKLTPGQEIGLKWGMSCANDTFEGVAKYTVPEPAPLALMLLGLGAIGLVQRKRH